MGVIAVRRRIESPNMEPRNRPVADILIALENWLFIFNTLRPRQNGRHFPDDIFKYICFNENVLISIKFPLKFIPKVPVNNIPALVQIMAWRQPGDKPLSETMMVTLLTHICVARPQWVNDCDDLCHAISLMWQSSHRRVSMVVADTLVPLWHKDICSHNITYRDHHCSRLHSSLTQKMPGIYEPLQNTYF